MFYFWLGREAEQLDDWFQAMLPERHDIEADGFITVYPEVK
jgi:hypothetical protein